MNASAARPRVLHCHSTFAAGGKELRAVKLMNAFGGALDHAVVSAEPGEMAAKAHLERKVRVSFPADFPALTGFPSPGRLVAIAEAMKGYDLVLTYNWGAMDAVMAHTVFAGPLGLPPLIHHEDGFNEDETTRLKTRRNWYRRIALTRTNGLVVPSMGLERIAREVWKVSPARLSRIPNGIDTARFARPPEPGGFRVVKREGERWVGTLAGLRPVKQLGDLVQAVTLLGEEWHLVIIGDGPERDRVRALADELEISHRVHLPGPHPDPAQVIGLIDIFALSSRSEQFPLSVVEAMAAGLPVAAPAVGDIRAMVAEPNRPFICVAHDWRALGQMLRDLAAEPALAAEIGAANRARARELYDEAAMIARYRDLYGAALGREI
ncbi:MAG: glycosyltransferase [Erythrobacter sp.]|uniref:glycosyltransferase n=1 Tax=Erythrobacter sp. TaxID=1042 RepID=UPI0032EC4C79